MTAPIIINSLILIALLSAPELRAQPQLSLEQCLALSRANNLELRNASMALQSGKYSEEELYASQRPRLKASGNASYAPHSNRLGYDPAITDGGQVGAQIALQTPLYSWGTTTLKLNHIKADQKQREAYYARTERDVTASVKQLYVEILQGRDEVLLRTEAIGRLTEYLERVQLHYKGGLAGYGDILKTKNQLSSEKETLRKTQESLALSKLSLAELMGTDLDTAFQLSGTIDTMLLKAQATYSFDSATLPELTAARGEVEKGLIDLELTKKERLPALSLTVDGGYLSSVDRLISSESKNALGFSAGVALEAPLLDWGVVRFRRLQQQLAVDTLQCAVRIVSRSLLSEFNKTLLQLNNARIRLGLIRERIKNADDDFLLAKSKYTAGASSASEVLIAQQAFIDAETDELQTKALMVMLAVKLEQFSPPTR